MTAHGWPRLARPACSCRTFAPETVAPGGTPLCWVCAHAVADHGADERDPDAIAAACASCACASAAIFPPDVLQLRAATSPVDVARQVAGAVAACGNPAEALRLADRAVRHAAKAALLTHGFGAARLRLVP